MKKYPDVNFNVNSRLIVLEKNVCHAMCITFLFVQDIVQKVMEGDFGSLSDSDLPTTKSKIIFFVSSTFTDTQAERNHLMKGMFVSDFSPGTSFCHISGNSVLMLW